MGRRNKPATPEHAAESVSKKRKIDEVDDKKEDKIKVKTNAVGAELITVIMPCPEKRMGLIIGKKGCVVAEIRKKSNCVILIDEQQKKNLPRPVNITGTVPNIGIAISLIKEVIDAPNGTILPWVPQKNAEVTAGKKAATQSSEETKINSNEAAAEAAELNEDESESEKKAKKAKKQKKSHSKGKEEKKASA